MVAALLAGAATGCSSDASRFDGIFSSTDNLTTNSIQRPSYGGAVGQAPVPRGDVMSSAPMASSAPLAQNYPQSGTSYEPINTATNSGSGARMASTPVSVQRSELAAPSAAQTSERSVALAQPFPATNKPNNVALAKPDTPDPLTTATTGTQSKNGWSTVNAPSVKLRPGESIAALANRYGVPEKEILKANGLKSASAVAPGQAIVIPTFGGQRNPVRAAAEAADLANQNKAPTPAKGPEQEVAVLPSATAGRDKASDAASGKLPAGDGKPSGGKGGSYVVKPGDSLAKIARTTGTSVDALKAANGISTSSIRIGQTLVIPGEGGADGVQTASIGNAQVTPAKAPAAAPGAGAKQPESYKAPVQTASISEVESKADIKEAAPEATGIGKYRWPVRGAVVNSYGSNVDGNRNDGINISVPSGTPIKAAENGVVIYAGNGLKELGNTVLVRHDDGTVTVYGHADSLNVTRGQKVQRGQTLAASGMSGSAKRPQVHFEVRKDATPVNPMTYLE